MSLVMEDLVCRLYYEEDGTVTDTMFESKDLARKR